MPEYIKAAQKADIPVGQGRAVDVGGQRIAIFNTEGEYFALEDRCSHADLPICSGHVQNGTVVCPWHHAIFDLRNGQPIDGPANGPVGCLNLRLDGDDIWIEV